MKSGLVKGTVVDPAGARRTLVPLLRCVEKHPVDFLKPGKSIRHSITLLRGAQGALFPMPGVHRIIVEMHWDSGGVETIVTG